MGTALYARDSSCSHAVVFRACVLGIALLAGRIAFRNKLVARGCGLLFVVVGYVVDRRAGWAVKFHALGVEHVFLRPI